MEKGSRGNDLASRKWDHQWVQIYLSVEKMIWKRWAEQRGGAELRMKRDGNTPGTGKPWQREKRERMVSRGKKVVVLDKEFSLNIRRGLQKTWPRRLIGGGGKAV